VRGSGGTEVRGFRAEETDEQVGGGGDHPRRADLDTDLRRRIYDA
jgi:hypothetical protein